MEVHRRLGAGFLERVYQLALAVEFRRAGIRHVVEQELPMHYRGEPLGAMYRLDFVVEGTIVVEIKAKDALGDADDAQLLNYLRAGDFELGVLLNFGAQSLEFRRKAWAWNRREPGWRSVL